MCNFMLRFLSEEICDATDRFQIQISVAAMLERAKTRAGKA
jgi:hypothetical protein